jgi:hypothetical protein
MKLYFDYNIKIYKTFYISNKIYMTIDWMTRVRSPTEAKRSFL